MKEKYKLNGYYNYTVILTYMGMLAGFTGILFVMDGRYQQAFLSLMIAGICDMFDGTVAATKQRTVNEKRFGIQIDSLSDLICFGVLPAMVTYSICEKSVWALVASGLYVLCALIRLAYFNVMEEERQTREEGSRTCYQGLPVTVAALSFPIFYMIGNGIFHGATWLMLAVLVTMALAFILPFEVKKPHLTGKILMILVGIVEFIMVCLGVGM